MRNLALRQAIAEKRGWADLAIVPTGLGDTVTGRPDAESGAGLRVPEWDCDLGAAGDLWAEIPVSGNGQLSKGIEEGKERVEAWANGGPYGTQFLATVHELEVPDPKERLCVVMCRLWLAWKEATA